MGTSKGPPTLERLIRELTKLPSIGRKTAQRLAFYLLKQSDDNAAQLANAIVAVKKRIRFCARCHNITEQEICDICSDPMRDKSIVCVVENVMDLYAFERSDAFKGVYHNLTGRLSPLDGIMPDDLTISKLLARIAQGEIKEVIIATNPDVAGEATATYLKEQIAKYNVKVTRIGVGIPIGGEFEYAGEVTIQRALEGRRDL